MLDQSEDLAASPELAALCAEEVSGLIEEGHEQGYVTGAQLAAALHDVDLTAEQVD